MLRSSLTLGAALLLTQAPPGLAQQGSVEERLARVERLLQTQALADLLAQVEALQREVQLLRGQLETQTHELTLTRERQSELYTELERRLQTLEGRAGPVRVTPSGAVVEQRPEASIAQPPPEAQNEPAAAPPPAQEAPRIAAAPPASAAPAEPEAAAGDPFSGDPAMEKPAYQQAFNLLKEGRYSDSIAHFNNFLVAYPNSEYCDNAQYWLGEAYYVMRQFEPAIGEYQRLIQAYPESDKLTHSMLKIGYSYHELGLLEEARRALQDLIDQHPDSTAARLAQDRLQRIALETP